jgi:hypothetical protein
MTSAPLPPARARRSVAPPLVALFVAAFGFLPIANWIHGGHDAPWYAEVASGWLSGSAIVIGVGVVLAILSRRSTFLWRDGALDRLVAVWREHPRRSALVVTLLALAAYLSIARLVFDGRPLFIDELTQVLQAQIFAGGKLWQRMAPHPEFFSSMLVADFNGRHFSQFPAGGPAMLLPGVLIGAPWVVGPICAAISVLAFAAFVRIAEPRPGVGMGATIIFAFAPFALFMSGSHMNNVPTLMWVVIAMAAMARTMTSDSARPGLALLSGFAFGCAAAIRPVDAFAFALPAGAWYLVRALEQPRRWADALAAGVGVALPMAALLWVNRQTTGNPLLFGYELLWGSSHGLGFHAAPWGMVHTPGRGVELINLYLLQLQAYLFESPLPSLLPVIGALALTRKFEAFDRYLIATGALLLGLYFAYWHDGFYLGPRFVYLLLPALALFTARFFPLVRDRFGAGLPYRSAVYGGICAVLIALTTLVPLRARQYRNSQVTMRWDADAAAASAGIDHALVLVRESWGAQSMARLWALGVPRSETELIYRSTDACTLDEHLSSLEAGSVRGAAAYELLRPLFADSARLVGSPFSPDTTERYLPGLAYSPHCVARIDADRQGFTLLLPLLLAHGGDNVYARELGERDSLLLRRYPTRPVYLLHPESTRIGELPHFHALSRDSLLRGWSSGPRESAEARATRK